MSNQDAITGTLGSSPEWNLHERIKEKVTDCISRLARIAEKHKIMLLSNACKGVLNPTHETIMLGCDRKSVLEDKLFEFYFLYDIDGIEITAFFPEDGVDIWVDTKATNVIIRAGLKYPNIEKHGRNADVNDNVRAQVFEITFQLWGYLCAWDYYLLGLSEFAMLQIMDAQDSKWISESMERIGQFTMLQLRTKKSCTSPK